MKEPKSKPRIEQQAGYRFHFAIRKDGITYKVHLDRLEPFYVTQEEIEGWIARLKSFTPLELMRDRLQIKIGKHYLIINRSQVAAMQTYLESVA